MGIHVYTHTYIYISAYTHTYMCVGVYNLHRQIDIDIEHPWNMWYFSESNLFCIANDLQSQPRSWRYHCYIVLYR